MQQPAERTRSASQRQSVTQAYEPPVQHVDKKKKIIAGVGAIVLLATIIGVVLGVVLGTSKKTVPPAVDATNFLREDWDKVMVGEKTHDPLTDEQASKAISVMTYPGTLTSFNVLGLCEYAGTDLREKKLAKIEVTRDQIADFDWTKLKEIAEYTYEDGTKRTLVAIFDPRYPPMCEYEGGEIKKEVKMFECMLMTQNGTRLKGAVPMDASVPIRKELVEKYKSKHDDEVHFDSLVQCVKERAQFEYVRAELNKQLAIFGLGDAVDVPTGFVTAARRRLLSHFSGAAKTETLGDTQSERSDADGSRPMKQTRWGHWHHRHHSHHRHHRHFGNAGSSTAISAVKFAQDAYYGGNGGYADNNEAKHKFNNAATQVYVYEVGATTYVAFRGSDEAKDWMYNLNAQSTPVGGIGTVHKGFWQAYADSGARDWVKSKVQGKSNVVFCGHSLGGALSALAAADKSYLGFERNIKWEGFGSADPFKSGNPLQSSVGSNGGLDFIYKNDPVPCAAQVVGFFIHPNNNFEKRGEDSHYTKYIPCHENPWYLGGQTGFVVANLWKAATDHGMGNYVKMVVNNTLRR